MLNRQKNYYEATDVNSGGGKQYGSDIHGVTIQTNQVIWDMIKVLDKNEQYGFYFTAKIAIKKTIIIMYHEDEKMLERGKKLLKDFYDIPKFLFLAKIKKSKSGRKLKAWILALSLLSLLMGSGYFVYLNKEYFIELSKALFPVQERSSTERNESEEIVEEVVQIDIKKLKALQESFDKQEKDPLQEKITKGMQMSVAVISSMVSDEEKEKYSSKDLVKNFKGKSGLKFELKKDENSSDEEFDMSVKELNSYVGEFIKDNNSSELLKGYDRVLKSDKSVSQSDLAVAHNEMGDLYMDVEEFEKAQVAFSKSLTLSKSLAKKDSVTYTGCVALNLTKLSDVDEKLNQKKKAKKELDEAEKSYLKVLAIYRELEEKNPKKFQTNIAWSLNMLANFYHEKRKDFKESIKYRKEAVDIYQKLAKEKPKIFEESLFKTFNSLATSYSSIDKLKLAKEYYQKSLSIMEKKAKEEGDDRYNIPIAMVYNSLAWIDLSSSKFREAKKRINHTFSLFTKEDEDDEESKIVLSTSYAYLGYLSLLQNRRDEGLNYYLKSFNLSKRFDSAKSYVNILIEKKSYMKANKFFELMLKTYKEREQQAEIWMMYGKFYLDISPEGGKLKLEKALSIYQEISKDKNSTEYRELLELMDSNTTTI